MMQDAVPCGEVDHWASIVSAVGVLINMCLATFLAHRRVAADREFRRRESGMRNRRKTDRQKSEDTQPSGTVSNTILP